MKVEKKASEGTDIHHQMAKMLTEEEKTLSILWNLKFRWQSFYLGMGKLFMLHCCREQEYF